ncbi:hypothetical protein [Anabaena sp. CA = ATCC 33047]|uniref:hypothetical protein n=1 Tax=Anabaena sp. (strain CA / ATCC 33047) TaxID=52271 RepID=UPI000AE31A58|nr:hypothetical protein [Anabaena sp. CA = ATCC 33047]
MTVTFTITMFNNPFSIPSREEPTQFEKDIDNLVETLKNKVTVIYDNHSHSLGVSWIYGTENQGMVLFISKADEILEKYSCNLKENEPKNIYDAYQYLAQQVNNKYSDKKNLAIELAKWIHDCDRELRLVPRTGDLKLALTEIDSLKSRLSDFKHF